jgi:hypothetical protein
MATTIDNAQLTALTSPAVLTALNEQVKREDALLRILPFNSIPESDPNMVYKTFLEDNSLTAAQRNASARALNGTPSNNTFEVVKDYLVSLKIFTKYADMDRQNLNLSAVRINQAYKGLVNKFVTDFIKGSEATDANTFNGLQKVVTSGQEVTMGANGDTLTLAKLNETIDKVPGANVMVMNKTLRRKVEDLLNTQYRQIEVLTQVEGARYGMDVVSLNWHTTAYRGIPIMTLDDDTIMAFDETQGTSDLCSSIYVLRINPMDGIFGIQRGGIGLGANYGEVPTLSGKQLVFEWATSWHNPNPRNLARLKGITNS